MPERLIDLPVRICTLDIRLRILRSRMQRENHIMGFRKLAALFSCAALAGCAQISSKDAEGPAGSTPHVDGRTYSWAEGVSEDSSSHPSIRFEDGRISGNAGCNSFSGSYKLEGKSFRIEPNLAVTMKMCSPNVSKSETEFLTMLSTARFMTEDADAVYLWDKDGIGLLKLVAPKKN